MSVGHFENRSMSLTIMLENQILYQCDQIFEKNLDFKFDIAPNQNLTICVDGKEKNFTKVDADGNILEDMHVKIDQVIINSMPIKKWILETKFFNFLTNDGKISTSNYFGQNGKTHIKIEQDLLKFFLNLLTK